MNVWEYGVNTGYIKLAARILGSNLILCRGIRRPDYHQGIITEIPSGDSPYVFSSYDYTFLGTGNFPWTYEVEPDRP